MNKIQLVRLHKKLQAELQRLTTEYDNTLNETDYDCDYSIETPPSNTGLLVNEIIELDKQVVMVKADLDELHSDVICTGVALVETINERYS